MCGQSGVSKKARILMPACGPRFALIPGGLTVAERRFGRYPAFMSAEMAVRRRRRDALLALRKDRVRGAAPARLNNGHWIAVTEDGQ
jgi:hypothetical protein